MKLREILKQAIIEVSEVIPHLKGKAQWIAIQALEEKTVSYYTRVLKRNIRRLYNGEINTNLFVDNLAGYVERQFRRAWNEGMRLNGLTPPGDMTSEWEAIYQQLVVDEYQYIERLAEDILQAKREGRPVDPFLSRADLWANRYTEVVNRSIAETKPDQLLTWEWGATLEHCYSPDNEYNCADLAGQTKTGKQWAEFVLPQSRKLTCGGWRCDCRLTNGQMQLDMVLQYQADEMLFAPGLQ